MELHFSKYHGAGNDFILVDNREGAVSLDTAQVAHLCHRRFGIGADGLMLLQAAPEVDFEMVYFNADGRESTMCGNGGRCIAAFAHHLGVAGSRMRFRAVDGLHEARILEDGHVALQMQDVSGITVSGTEAVLDTGSPHFVRWVEAVKDINVFREGRAIRNRESFGPGGINVNFIQRQDDGLLLIRTYERGVEDETLACGTGVTAAAIVATGTGTGHFEVPVQAMGGRLSVTFDKTAAWEARNIVLTGGAVFVFSGTVPV